MYFLFQSKDEKAVIMVRQKNAVLSNKQLKIKWKIVYVLSFAVSFCSDKAK